MLVHRCYVPLLVPTGHVSTHITSRASVLADGSIWATVVPGWITAIGTAGLLIGAIVTAIYAIKAFHEQSQQLADQRKVNAEQTIVLELQTRELNESLAERKREAKQRKIAQASQVFIWTEATDEPVGEGRQRLVGRRVAIIAHLKNTSQQPVYDLVITWRKESVPWGEPEVIGSVLMPGEETSPMRVIDPSLPGHGNISLFGAVAHFRDAAGRHWRAYVNGPPTDTDIEEEREEG